MGENVTGYRYIYVHLYRLAVQAGFYGDVVECLTATREIWARVPVESRSFSLPVTFGGSVWVRARAASSKETVSSVPAWFRADSGTNLFKQGDIVTG